MSPNVGNFVHDLVEMAKAMETLPQVQHELEAFKKGNTELAQTVQDREEAILRYKAEIERLQSKVRATEAERDDAELRFLGLEEKTDKVLDMLVMVKAYASDAKETLSPPKPQPVPEPVQPPVSEAVQSIEPQSQGQGESHPTSPDASGQVSEGSQNATTATQTDTAMASPTPQPPASQDQSEVNPTNPVTEQATSASLNDAKNSDAGNTAEPTASGPYTGKRYLDVPGYVSYDEWITGGGTYASYWQDRS